jgi:hypothetical protein
VDPGRKKKLIRVLVAIVALSALGLTLFTLAALNYSYSKGERVGFVQKLSHRGWICKTNEGDLAMVNLPGQPAENFPFTVPDDKLVAEINALAGHKVALTYEEHRGVPFSCFGETRYFVTGVRKTD